MRSNVDRMSVEFSRAAQMLNFRPFLSISCSSLVSLCEDRLVMVFLGWMAMICFLLGCGDSFGALRGSYLHFIIYILSKLRL